MPTIGKDNEENPDIILTLYFSLEVLLFILLVLNCIKKILGQIVVLMKACAFNKDTFMWK